MVTSDKTYIKQIHIHIQYIYRIKDKGIEASNFITFPLELTIYTAVVYNKLLYIVAKLAVSCNKIFNKLIYKCGPKLTKPNYLTK